MLSRNTERYEFLPEEIRFVVAIAPAASPYIARRTSRTSTGMAERARIVSCPQMVIVGTIILRRFLMSGQTSPRNGSSSWYVVHCRRPKEFYAEAALRERLGIHTYLPIAVSRVGGVTREIPFFPGYLFVNAVLDEGALSKINTTPGVVRLVEFAGERPAVPDALVSAIKERLEALNAQGGRPSHNFHVGDTVELKSGPFSGLTAIFRGPTTPAARVKILLEFLGRPHEIEVGVEMLTTGHDYSPSRGQRRTRGRGRRIRTEERACRHSV
jgi:transcriptional antiterminator RfaH